MRSLAALATLTLVAGCAASTGAADTAGTGMHVLKGVSELPPPDGTASAATGAAPPATMQYLYGSGEAAALDLQVYGTLSAYLANDVAFRRKDGLTQMVLAPGATPAAPQFEACAGKPPAIVLDVDETVLLNLGYEADAARRGESFDDARWRRWERTGAGSVRAVPGAAAALAAARSAGITVIFSSNRSAASATATAAALDGAGLGPARHGETLWLKGDADGASGKDGRRAAIARHYCVVAMVGDQLGDFADAFNDPALSPARRRALAASPALAKLWGKGWFLLPNPVYGPALKGGYDDVFPQDVRWNDPVGDSGRGGK